MLSRSTYSRKVPSSVWPGTNRGWGKSARPSKPTNRTEKLTDPSCFTFTRSHLIKARTPWKGRHLQDETVETQPNHHFPPDSITAGLWFPCHKTIYEISSNENAPQWESCTARRRTTQ